MKTPKEKLSVAFSPNYRGNPYQGMMYSQVPGRRIALDARDVPVFLATDRQTEIFHQHWLKEIFLGLKSDEHGYGVVDEYFNALERFRDRGGRVLWTVHNLLEHDLPEHARELNLHCMKRMIDVADRIHVHSQAAFESIGALTGRSIGSKSALIPHPLYDHMVELPQFPPLELRIQPLPGKTRFLMFGMLRPYKGGRDLLEAFLEIKAQRSLRSASLVLAGRIYDDGLKHLLASGHPALKHVLVIDRRVSDSELASLCRWADVAVLPYRKIHISGSYYQAATFALPCLVPRLGMFRNEVKQGDTGLVFEPGQLAKGLLDAHHLGRDRLRKLGKRTHKAVAHQTESAVSGQLATLLQELRKLSTPEVMAPADGTEATSPARDNVPAEVDENNSTTVLSFCIPVMNRLSDLKSTLARNLEDNRSSAGRVEFIVVSFDAEDETENWIRQNFARDLESGYLRFYRRRDLPFWHFGIAKNAFKPLLRGEIYASLDGDNFTGPDGGEYIISVFETMEYQCVLHQFQGEWGDGTCGRISLARDDYVTHGYDERFLPRQWDELDALLSVLANRRGHTYVCYRGRSIFDKSHPFKRFLRDNQLQPEVRELVPESDPLFDRLNQKAVGLHDNNYVRDDPVLRTASVVNHLQSFLKNTHSDELRNQYVSELVDAQRELVEATPADKLLSWVLEAQAGNGPAAPHQDDIVVLACMKNEPEPQAWYAHYKALGATRFLLVDDDSDTPLTESLPHADVHIWRPRVGRFRHAKVLWLEALLKRYCQGLWCLTVDGDEFLMLPEWEASSSANSTSLQILTSLAEQQSLEYFCGFMLDLLPPPGTEHASSLPREAFTHYQYRSESPDEAYLGHNTVQWSYRGHAHWAYQIDCRYTMNGTLDSLRKFPVFRYKSGTHLNQGFHDLIINGSKRSADDLRRTDLLPLLHYKLWHMAHPTHGQSRDFSAYHHQTRKNLSKLVTDIDEKVQKTVHSQRVFPCLNYGLLPLPSNTAIGIEGDDSTPAGNLARLNRTASFRFAGTSDETRLAGYDIYAPTTESALQWLNDQTPFITQAGPAEGKSGRLDLPQNAPEKARTRYKRRTHAMSASTPDLIVFFSRPRTGTNYLVNLLRRSGSIISKSEIFHMHQPWGLSDDELVKIFGRKISPLGQEQRANVVRSEPEKVIAFLKDKAAGTGKPVSFKIFPGHLDFDVIDGLLLADPNIAKCLVDRDKLDTYLSTLKALKIGQWTHADTSDVKVAFRAQHLEQWYEKMDSWYRFLRDRMNDRDAPFTSINYESFTGLPEQEALAKIFNALGALGLDLKYRGDGLRESAHKKQDRRGHGSESMTNWNEFTHHELYPRMQNDQGPQSFLSDLGLSK